MKTLTKKLSVLSAAALFAFGALFAGYPVAAQAQETLVLSKPALELAVGESELITAAGEDIVWSSADEGVATVSESGIIEGVSVGETTVTAQAGDGSEATVPVYVIEKERGFDDNILISVFWPPTAEYMNGGESDERWDEQYRLLSEAGVDYLCNVTGRDRQQNIGTTPKQENTKETNLKMAYYAHKYGMRVTVADERFSRFQSMSAVQIGELISEYRNVPGVGGYYILDEPVDPMPYTEIYSAIKEADPSGYAHLNFLPLNYYIVYANDKGLYKGLPPEQAYRKIIGDWLQANEDAGYPQDYVMYDLYPFDLGKGFQWDLFYQNINAVREVGLEYNVKTALYLQSCKGVRQDNPNAGYRRPSPSEIRFEAMVSLAYGFKQLSYFTWFQPTNRDGEYFYDSIISAEGEPNPETYEPIKQLNGEIHTLGKTLIRLDSLEVHLNGAEYGGQTEIPSDFVFQPMDATQYTVSLMKDKFTGRNYVMLVNNDYTDPASFDINLNVDLPGLQRVSPQDGSLIPVEVSDGNILEVSLGAGDGILYALPEGMDFTSGEIVPDRTQADAEIARWESEKENYSENGQKTLSEAVENLKAALAHGYYTQEYIDTLTSRLKDLLGQKELLKPDGTKTPGGDVPAEDGGCGAVMSVGPFFAAALFAALALCLRRRKN